MTKQEKEELMYNMLVNDGENPEEYLKEYAWEDVAEIYGINY